MTEPKPLFLERMQKLLPDRQDFQNFLEINKTKPQASIRCNTTKVKPEQLKARLESRGWEIKQPFLNHQEIMIIQNSLLPGEIGKSIEHNLGYYYIQGIASMMPVLALNPKQNEILLDLCAAPGSKTTQASSLMQNSGIIIANETSPGRIGSLIINTEKYSCSNVIIARHDAVQLCEKLAKLGMKFDKILIDVSCSEEGNIRNNPEILKRWNIKTIKNLGKLQKKLASSAVPLLKKSGELVYSTCTLSPEENESVISFLASKFNLKIKKTSLPIKTRQGIQGWQGEKFSGEIKNCCRIYPQDNNTEGFFLAKLKKEEK